MADIWNEIVLFFNDVINAISTYVHSPLSIEIDRMIAEAFNELADACVYVIRDIMDIFGR